MRRFIFDEYMIDRETIIASRSFPLPGLAPIETIGSADVQNGCSPEPAPPTLQSPAFTHHTQAIAKTSLSPGRISQRNVRAARVSVSLSPIPFSAGQDA